MCAVIWLTAWVCEPSSLVLHIVAYAAIALSIIARFVWEETSEQHDSRS